MDWISSGVALFDPIAYVQNLFMAAGGIAAMLGLPVLAKKFKGGLPLLAIGVILAGFYLHDNGYLSF